MVLTFIPKLDCAAGQKDYQPLGCCNTIHYCFCKVLSWNQVGHTIKRVAVSSWLSGRSNFPTTLINKFKIVLLLQANPEILKITSLLLLQSEGFPARQPPLHLFVPNNERGLIWPGYTIKRVEFFPKCASPRISHVIMPPDDSIILVAASDKSFHVIKETLSKLKCYLVFGQSYRNINFSVLEDRAMSLCQLVISRQLL